jgi:hypothetical protein
LLLNATHGNKFLEKRLDSDIRSACRLSRKESLQVREKGINHTFDTILISHGLGSHFGPQRVAGYLGDLGKGSITCLAVEHRVCFENNGWTHEAICEAFPEMNEFLIVVSEYSKDGPVHRFVDIPEYFGDDAPGQMRESRWAWNYLGEKLLRMEGTEAALKVRLVAPRSLTEEDDDEGRRRRRRRSTSLQSIYQ